MSDSANDFLMGGGGAPSAKFPTIGTTVKGTIVSFETTQQIDFATKLPKKWDDGNPMMQLVVTLQTEERDPDEPDDDGKRRLFVKSQMREAVADAVRAVGGNGLEHGATLAVRYESDKPSQRGNPTKIYRAQYQRPTADVGAGSGVSADDLIG